MKKVIAIVAVALFTVSMNAQEPKQEKKRNGMLLKRC